MKTLFITLIALVSLNANAAQLADFAAIARSSSLQEIEKSRVLGYLYSVDYKTTMRCLGGPSIYSLRFQDGEKTCLLSVQVGTCGSTGKRFVESHQRPSEAECKTSEM
ncbi:MAG: hypothetical protein AB7O96_09040 [Pseudobdellovibrionaceae bacterium]